MKKIFILFISLLALAGAGHAQNARKSETDTSKKAKTIGPAMASQIREIVSSSKLEAQRLMTDTSVAPAQRMARYRQLMLIRTNKIDSVMGRTNRRVYRNAALNPAAQH